jgi:hypothetical protein
MNNDAKLELAIRASNIGIWDWDLLTNRFGYSDRARASGEITYQMVREVKRLEIVKHRL